METYGAAVKPALTTNLFLDHVLKMRRGPDGVELVPEMCMTSGDGYLHHAIVSCVGQEAAYWVVGDEDAVACDVHSQLLRPAMVDKGLIIGIGRLLRVGKTTMVSEACVTQDMKLLAKVSVTFVHYTGKL